MSLQPIQNINVSTPLRDSNIILNDDLTKLYTNDRFLLSTMIQTSGNIVQYVDDSLLQLSGDLISTIDSVSSYLNDALTNSSVKAWVTFNASTGTPVISGDFNVNSIVDYGTGSFGVAFTTHAPNNRYSGVVSVGGTGLGRATSVRIDSQTSALFKFVTLYEADSGAGNWGVQDFQFNNVIVVW